MTIDTHLHMWQRREGHYSWLGPEHGVLFDDFPPELADAELRKAGVEGAILVQADDTLDDALYMFDVADRYDWALGVVAWLPLDSPERSREVVDRYLTHTTLSGVRQLVHDDPRDNFYRLPEVHEVADLLAEHSIPLDIPDAYPRDLPQVVDLASQHPELTLVLDHMGKPPVAANDFREWLAMMTAFAENPNTVVKFSGLHHPERPFTRDGIERLWDLALELFGPDRMMVGSDWPITVLYGGYWPTWETLQTLLSQVSPVESQAIGSDTAYRVYGRSEKVVAAKRKEKS